MRLGKSPWGQIHFLVVGLRAVGQKLKNGSDPDWHGNILRRYLGVEQGLVPVAVKRSK